MDGWKREKADSCRSLLPFLSSSGCLIFPTSPSLPTRATTYTNTVSAEESQEGILITSESQEETNLKNNSARDHFLLIVRFTF